MRLQLQLQLDDDTYDAYVREATRRGGVSVPVLFQETLKKFAGLSDLDRYLVLPPPARARLEEVLHVQVTTPEQLLKAVEDHAAIRIGTIRVDATPQQLRELQDRAEREGKSVEEAIHKTYSEIAKFFFNASSLGSGRSW